MTKVLYLGQEETAARKLCTALRKEGYDVVRWKPAAELPANAALAVMDASLQWTVCRPLLSQFQTLGLPVLFITANREMHAHLRALYPGQCDVLSSPFTPKQLKAKLENLLHSEPALRPLTVDEQESVALLDGERVELTAQELALLLALMEAPDTPVSREQLLRRAWGYQSMGETRTVDVHVQRLRKKLGVDRIETVYKCGYRLKMA